MSGWIGTLISGVALIIVAIIESTTKHDRKRTEARAARRERESRLSMDMMSASLDLAYVTSLAVTGGHTNGNVEAAQTKAKAAQEAYETFLRDETAKAVSKV